MRGWIDDFLQRHDQYAWLFQLAFTVIITFAVYLVAHWLYRHLVKQANKTKLFWDDVFLEALYRPVMAFIFFIGFTYALVIFLTHFSNAQTDVTVFAVHARKVGTIVLITWFLMRFVKRAEYNLVHKTKGNKARLDATTANALAKICYLIILLAAAISIMQAFGQTPSGLLAIGGVGALAVSLAAKEPLANLFGGFMIYYNRPFKVGDWIRSPDKNIEGTVEKINWFLTIVRTFDKRPLYIPNALFGSISVENPSRMTNRRIKTTIGVRYDDAQKIPKILADVKRMLQEHPEIDTKQTMLVNLVGFGDSALEFLVYTFTKTTQWVAFQDIQEDVFLKILDIIDQNGAECAFPTRTLHMSEGLNVNNLTH